MYFCAIHLILKNPESEAKLAFDSSLIDPVLQSLFILWSKTGSDRVMVLLEFLILRCFHVVLGLMASSNVRSGILSPPISCCSSAGLWVCAIRTGVGLLHA